MARSPLTLAASVTSALPRAEVVSVAPLSEGAEGDYDAALVTLRDGERVVVRVPNNTDADAALAAEVRALDALSAGVRGQLPFGAPRVLGTTSTGGSTVLVQDYLPGYRVDAGHVPPGPGIATALGAAIARIHALPVAIVRDAGLVTRTNSDIRADVEKLLDRAEATGALPFGLLRRWSTALGTERLWRFEPTVTLGGVDPGRFVFVDNDGIPEVMALLTWGGLAVGDPAEDLRWVASAPDARRDVFDAYTSSASFSPDGALTARARLYAELEFARWLAHGHETGAASVLEDAVALLTALDEGVRDEPLLEDDRADVDDALDILDRVPDTAARTDTSMQTDTYDPAQLAAYLSPDDHAAHADIETVPIDLSDWTPDGGSDDHRTGPVPDPSSDPHPTPTQTADPLDTDADHDEAARNALRRWTGAN